MLFKMLTTITPVLFRPSIVKNMIHGCDHLVMCQGGVNILFKDLNTV